MNNSIRQQKTNNEIKFYAIRYVPTGVLLRLVGYSNINGKVDYWITRNQDYPLFVSDNLSIIKDVINGGVFGTRVSPYNVQPKDDLEVVLLSINSSIIV